MLSASSHLREMMITKEMRGFGDKGVINTVSFIIFFQLPPSLINFLSTTAVNVV